MVLWFNTLSLSLLTMTSLGSVRPIIYMHLLYENVLSVQELPMFYIGNLVCVSAYGSQMKYPMYHILSTHSHSVLSPSLGIEHMHIILLLYTHTHMM